MLLTKFIRQLRGRENPNGHENRLRSVEQMRGIVERERSRADRIGIEFAVLKFTARDKASASETLGFLIRVLQDRLRCTDEVGWLDQQEIGVVLPCTPASGARTVANAVVLKFDERTPPECELYFYPPNSSDLSDALSEVEAERSREGCEPVLTAGEMDSLFLRPTPPWKRFIDVVGAVVGLILLSPVFAIAALAVRFSSPGPVLFVQPRSGLGGKQFRMYKFRTMIVGAERKQAELLSLNEQQGPVFKIRNDPRITRVGRILRKTSIDELPQLWNVLKGEMSLVGPRPPIQKEVNQYEGWHRRRLDVTPGITCTWQVQGRSLIPFTEWIRMDIRYIQSRSVTTDLRLLLLTIPAVLMRRGAN